MAKHIHIHMHDAGFEESKHPRASNGQFGSGGGSKVAAKTSANARHALAEHQAKFRASLAAKGIILKGSKAEQAAARAKMEKAEKRKAAKDEEDLDEE